MDRDTDLFVQAFWVKCREVVRPEVDTAIAVLRVSGHDAQVSTQEYSATADGLPTDNGPSLIVTMQRGGADSAAPSSLEFRGDVANQAIDVLSSHGRQKSYDIANLGVAEVRLELENWLARFTAS